MTREVTTVNPKFGRRSWVKLWVNEWLDGTTRFEMTDAQRAFWIDLLAMAGRSRFPGKICAGVLADGSFVGYPLNRFQALMTTPIDIEQTFSLFERTGKIKMSVTSTEPVRLVMIELLNWDRYQSEYQRQKKYRKGYEKGTTGGYTQGNKTETEGEVEGEEKQTHACAPTRFETPEFQKFWNLYPNKLNRQDAFRAWCRVPFADKEHEKIIAGLEVWKHSVQWKEERYIPTAAKFLKDERWTKLPPKEAPSGSSKRNSRPRNATFTEGRTYRDVRTTVIDTDEA